MPDKHEVGGSSPLGPTRRIERFAVKFLASPKVKFALRQMKFLTLSKVKFSLRESEGDRTREAGSKCSLKTE